jgi:hypothetical protein
MKLNDHHNFAIFVLQFPGKKLVFKNSKNTNCHVGDLFSFPIHFRVTIIDEEAIDKTGLAKKNYSVIFIFIFNTS